VKPYLSIVIPYFNSESTIKALLDSICASKNSPAFEVIVVDDGSKVELRIKNLELKIKNKKVIRVIRFPHNKGPAAARNRGVREARGKFLVFLDSDVRLFPDTLHNLAKIYKDDPDVVALTGVWVKEQESQAFFPNFKALRDWSYWINERDKSGYYFLFSTRIASIKKAVFLRLGGFDEKYPGALVEDIELTYRIARRYAIIFAPDVRVHHEFEGFWPIATKYFLRAYHWSHLYAQRRKFDPVATTLQEAVTALSGTTLILMICFNVCVFSSFWVLSLYQGASIKGQVVIMQISLILNTIPLILLFVHVLMVRKFLLFMYQEKGFGFAVKGFFTGLVLYCFITAGAFWGRLRR
jgi:glycosyltransferase involved in cell wall biosynthesis